MASVIKSQCENGVYSISLPLENGEEAKMSGVCVENITVPFPKYPLKVEDDFRKNIAKINSDMLPHLPRLPNEVGGKVDIMIGKQYLKYFPKEIAKLGSGLTLYTSRFRSPDGSKAHCRTTSRIYENRTDVPFRSRQEIYLFKSYSTKI